MATDGTASSEAAEGSTAMSAKYLIVVVIPVPVERAEATAEPALRN